MSAGKRHFSRERFIKTCFVEKLIITHEEPIEGIKVWILLGYSSKYCNYTSNRKLGRFPHSPRPPPQWITFFDLTKIQWISQKLLLYIKDVKFDLRMGRIHV